MSIQSKLISLFLLLSSLPVSIVAIIAYQNGHEVLKEDVGEKLEKSAYHTMVTIDRLLFDSQEHVRNWAVADVMQNLITAEADERITEAFMTWQKETKVFAGIFALTPQGKVVAATDPVYIGQEVSEESWFQAIVQTPGLSIGDVAQDRIIGGYTVNISAPVISSSDGTQIIGFLSARLDWYQLRTLINTIQQSGRTHLGSVRSVMINKEGFLIAGPKSVMETARSAVLRKNFLELGYESARWALLGQRGKLLEIDPEGKEFLIGYSGSEGYRDFRGMGWAVLI